MTTPLSDEAEVIPTATLPFATEWTVDDLDALPDDGLQHELIDGLHIVSPAPVSRHQRAVREVFLALHAAAPSDVEVFFAPLDWRPNRRVTLQPDVLVVEGLDDDALNVTHGLLLAVEVLSPSTRRKDRILKFGTYQEHGVASYWIIDPDEPSITCWDLVDGVYVEVGQATGSESVSLSHPFPVSITPEALLQV